MQKKNLRNLFVVSGLLVAFSLPFLIPAITRLSDRSATVEKEKLSSEAERFETRGDYKIKEGKVVFDFELINHYPEAKELQFGSGQQFEIVIRDEKDEEVYRYSEGKAFTLALVFRNIDPGASLAWQDRWDMRDQEGKMVSPGRYRAEIEIMPIPNEDDERIEASQLRTSIEFTLAEAEELGLNEDGIITSAAAKGIIAELADDVMHAISNRDGENLAAYVHPKKGVRFTPYTYVNLEEDLVFTPPAVRSFFTDQHVYCWGSYDGTGDPINLTPSEYYSRFIYSEDFLNAEEIGYNEVLSSGNMLENQFEVYESPIVVEYYFPGFNPDYMGMDWRSLRLVFEEDGDDWKLTGVIHNQWTI